MQAALYTAVSAAGPSQPLMQYMTLRSNEQATRQFCDKNPFQLHAAPFSSALGEQLMCVPLMAPRACLKYDENLGLAAMNGDRGLDSEGSLTYLV